MKYAISKAVLDPEKVKNSGLSAEDLGRYVPKYLYQPTPIECGWLSYWFFSLILTLLTTMLKVFLRPRKGEVGKLDLHEVEAVYDKEARHYDLKHHLTTRGKDTSWRRQAGWFVAGVAKRLSRDPKVLDLCTGTGLTIKEMLTVLIDNGRGAEIVGLDYNERMLQVARTRPNGKAHDGLKVEYVRGDAMRLYKSPEAMSNGLAKFGSETFDAVTQMFGIGGIDGSQDVFKSVLLVLKADGDYQVIDMHQPLAHQSGEVPLLWHWLRVPVLEYLAYHYHTVPVALNRLWGWKDPTLDFYRLPLTTVCDEAGNWWGFEVVSFETESQRWWFGLPIMPVAHIVVRKKAISQDEAKKREQALSLLVE